MRGHVLLVVAGFETGSRMCVSESSFGEVVVETGQLKNEITCSLVLVE